MRTSSFSQTLFCPRLLRYFSQPEQLSVLKALVECEQPTADLYKFYGKIEIFPDNAVELNGEVPLGRSSLMTIQSSESERKRNSVRRTSVNVNNDTPISRNSVVSFRASKISSEIPVDRNSVIKVNSDFNKNTDVNFQDSNNENHHNNTAYETNISETNKRRTTVRTNSGLSVTSSRRHSVSLSAPLGTENILLRGTRLKNTEYVYGE